MGELQTGELAAAQAFCAMGSRHPCEANRKTRPMTYPELRYLGTGGEISATHRPAGGTPELTYQGGNTVHYLATGASTNGEFGLYLWTMGPDPSGPDPHFHRTISESFYVLSG